MIRAASAVVLVALFLAAPAAQRRPEAGQPRQSAVDLSRLDEIPPLVEAAIRDKQLPGAVVLIGRGDRVVYQKAIGNRAVEPSIEPMTSDTIFDLASLTKVVATTPSVMKLVEGGRIRLSDRVASFIPGFERHNKANITVRHLMTHTSGLRPDLDLAEPWSGYEKGIELAIDEVPTAPPGERFVYSDINYILLGEIVRRVSGSPLDEFAAAHVF
ncbi:MAG TPA: serine hydrolase domain-containing protein, partial [Vicinamibacterales bacterium]